MLRALEISQLALTSNFSRLPLLMHMDCQEFVFWTREGGKEKRKNRRNL